ncbi:MAG TPA: DUF1194 domain-containing protein [Paracoccaceae bacterium]|nr:DUF1194 domain-containing protein [Paracoccaceae bacterium]HMO71889.1 DUF1194 domain-containing protein [Paracoccaceae bacterium]
MLRVLALLALLAAPARATEVDVALVLLADTTGSIDQSELMFQREGYARAITDPRVITAIRSTLTGRIAVTYVEFGSADSQAVIVPWTVIGDESSARLFARDVLPHPRLAFGRNGFGGALLFGKALIETAPVTPLRKVIDFSADSTFNRTGPSLPAARAEVLAAGITINGLAVVCLMCSAATSPETLVESFRREIIGGPGAFVLGAATGDEFVDAVRRKLILEIAGAGGVPVMAAVD